MFLHKSNRGRSKVYYARAWLALFRIEYPVLAFASVMESTILVAKECRIVYLLPACGVTIVVAASFALNDFCDIASDTALMRKDRPLVTGAMKPRDILFSSGIMFSFGFGLCLTGGNSAVLMMFAYLTLGIVYDLCLKRLPFVGNVAIASCTAAPLIYGNLVASGSLSNIQPAILVFALAAFFVSLGKELFDSVRDIEGDKQITVRSLPMIIGIKPVLLLGSFFWIIVAVGSPLVMLYKFSVYYAVPAGVSALLLMLGVRSALKASCASEIARIEQYYLLSLILGMVSLAGLSFSA